MASALPPPVGWAADSRCRARLIQVRSKMMSRAYDEMNPLAAATGGMLKLGGAAFNAAKSYRCVTCGSKMGAKASVA